MPKDDTYKCVKAWHSNYASHREIFESVFPLALKRQTDFIPKESFVEALEKGIVDYFLVIFRMKYMIGNAPLKTTTIPKLVSQINDLFTDYENIKTNRGDDEEYRMIKRHIIKWYKSIAYGEDDAIGESENDFDDDNKLDETLSRQPEIMLALAIIFQRLDSYRSNYVKANAAKKNEKSVPRYDKTTDGETVAACYDDMYDIFQKFVSIFCQDYPDVAWFMFESTYHMHFLSEYCKCESRVG